MDKIAPGIQEMNEMMESGFSQDEVEQYRSDTAREMINAGFTSQEIDQHFGTQEPDMSKIEGTFKSNLKTYAANSAAKETTKVELEGGEAPEIKQADTFLEAIEAGFDMSVSHLLVEKPDIVLPENAPRFHRIASMVSQLAGDTPFMAVGALSGAAFGGGVGSALPVVGTAAGAVVGGGAGAFALPEGLRTALMEHYEKGDIKTFGDFFDRASAIAISSAKGAVIGGATAGVGGAVGKVAVKAALPTVAKTTAQLTSEVATMTTVGAALEGKVPDLDEFIDASILVGGLRGSTKMASKVRNMYGKTGVKPTDIAAKAESDPHFKQQLLAENVEIPVNGELGIRAQKAVPPENFETTKPFKKTNPELPPEVNDILSKVGEKGEKPSKELTVSQVYTNLVDKLDPINEATKLLKEHKVDLPAEANPYILSRVAVDYKAKAKHFFEKGVLAYDGLKIKNDSLKSALESVESPEILDAYMISKRVIEKNSQGVQTGFDITAAEKVVKDHGKKYEAAAKKVTEFSNNVLDYVTDAGILSKEQNARIREANKDYVPFKRIIEQSDKPGAKKGGGKAGSLKEFKGSERDIQSPITSIVENTIELVRMAEVNRAKVALVELAEKSPNQELLVKMKAPRTEVTVSKEQVAKQLGISVEAAEAVSTFKTLNKELAPNEFAVYRDGKRQVYSTEPMLAEAISKIGGDQVATNMLFKIMRGFTTVKKISLTFTPEFITKNMFRDVLTGSTFTKGKGVSPFDVAGAMGDLWKKNDVYYEWLKSGGANGAFLEMSDRYIKTDIQKLQRETNFLDSARNVVRKPIDVMRVAAELSEQSIRLAEFKKVRKAGGTLTEGGFASREITIDFQRVGAKMAALNSITAFSNVSIQGLDRTVRAIKADPKGVAGKAALYITAPSVLLWWANHDDPRYQEIPRWEKDLFWIIPTDNWQNAEAQEAAGLPEYMVRSHNGKTQINKGAIYKLPKPQELGILFGSLPERTLEAFFTDNPGAFKDFGETMQNLVTPSFIPDAIAPAMEQYFNKSFFTGNDIVPHHLKGELPETQFVEFTSDTAKGISKLVRQTNPYSEFGSPLIIDNYIQSWGGSLGKYAIQVADASLKASGIMPDNVDPEGTLSDVPFIKAFVVRYPKAGSKSVQDFYDHYEKTQKVINSVEALQKKGDVDGVDRLLRTYEKEFLTGKMAEGIKQGLSNQNAMIRSIHRDLSIPANEKRQLIDEIYLQMIEISKEANAEIYKMGKELEEQK